MKQLIKSLEAAHEKMIRTVQLRQERLDDMSGLHSSEAQAFHLMTQNIEAQANELWEIIDELREYTL